VLPDFLILGAQKAGTTTLYDAVSAGRYIAGAARKEVHFFDFNWEKGDGWYRGWFPTATELGTDSGERRLTGEATPYYLFHPLVPMRVKETIPDARFIVLLREPATRAASHWAMNVRVGNEKKGFEEAIGLEPSRLDGEADLIHAGRTGKRHPHRIHSYMARGRYAEQIERWLEAFPKDRFLFLKSEDLWKNPTSGMSRVLQFLGLPDTEPPAVPVPDATRPGWIRGRQRWGRHWNRTISPDVLADLRQSFAGPNERLRALTGVSWDDT
jgi:hypothetical protein